MTMTFDYDKITDSLSIKFRTADIEESEEINPGVLLDLDDRGRMVSMEILNASKKLDFVDAIVINSKRVLVE